MDCPSTDNNPSNKGLAIKGLYLQYENESNFQVFDIETDLAGLVDKGKTNIDLLK